MRPVIVTTDIVRLYIVRAFFFLYFPLVLRLVSQVFHRQVAHRLALPAFVPFDELRADETVARGFVGEYAGDVGPALYLAHHTLHHVGRVDASPVFARQMMHGERLLELRADLLGQARITAFPTFGDALRFGKAHAHVGMNLVAAPAEGLVCRIPHARGDEPSGKHGTDKKEARRCVYANRRRIRGERGKALMRKRGERIERTFAHLYETGGMRRIHLREHENILKRLLIHGGAYNISLVMRKMFGFGKPRRAQDGYRVVEAVLYALCNAIRAILGQFHGGKNATTTNWTFAPTNRQNILAA